MRSFCGDGNEREGGGGGGGVLEAMSRFTGAGAYLARSKTLLSAAQEGTRSKGTREVQHEKTLEKREGPKRSPPAKPVSLLSSSSSSPRWTLKPPRMPRLPF